MSNINGVAFFWLVTLAVFGLLVLLASFGLIVFVLYQAIKQDKELHKQQNDEYEGLKRSLLSFFDGGESNRGAKV